MIISVLIPHYNDKRILDCLKTINKTTFRESLKVVIQDSNSNISIQENIKNLLHNQDEFHCEKDKGIFDGLNKLLDKINTPYFTWIGCDDFLDENYNFDQIISEFEKGANIIQSEVIYFDKNICNQTRRIKPYKNNFYLYSMGLPFYHFGSTIRSSIIKDSGLRFNLINKTAADFEFFRLFFKFLNKSSTPCSKSIIYLGDGGNSSSSLSARFFGYKDIFRSFKNYRILIFPIFLIVRVFFKLKSISK